MKRFLRSYLFFFSLLMLFSCYDRERIVDQRILSNYDFRLFQNTPAWELAKAVEDEDVEEITAIINEHPQLINFQSPQYGLTVLHLAVSHCKMESTKCLLKLGADVNIRDVEYGDTPLNKSCILFQESEGLEMIRLLIKKGANVNVTEWTGSTKKPNSALMTASFCGFTDAVKLLIDMGADVNYVGNRGSTALSESILTEDYEVAYYLLQHGADYTFPIIFITDDSKKGNGRIVRYVYIQEMLESEKIGYLTPGREYYYKIVDFLKDKGISVKETGERQFRIRTFINELRKINP